MVSVEAPQFRLPRESRVDRQVLPETLPGKILQFPDPLSQIQHIRRMVEIKRARLPGLDGSNLKAAEHDIEDYKDRRLDPLLRKNSLARQWYSENPF